MTAQPKKGEGARPCECGHSHPPLADFLPFKYWPEIMAHLKWDLRRSERLTAVDMAVTINARDDRVADPREERPRGDVHDPPPPPCYCGAKEGEPHKRTCPCSRWESYRGELESRYAAVEAAREEGAKAERDRHTSYAETRHHCQECDRQYIAEVGLIAAHLRRSQLPQAAPPETPPREEK